MSRPAPAFLSAMLIAGLTSGAFVESAPARAATDEERISDVRSALLRLPYYGVFDFLTFSVDKGTVTLDGYAYQLSLKRDAERAVKRVSGVDDVVVNVKDLSISPNDDSIRWRVFYAVYTNDFLSKYAPAGGLLWGHRHPFRSGMIASVQGFPGMQPVGNYPIHIVVDHGRVRLMGMVDNETDKTVAGMEANSVAGTFGVKNELVVDVDRKP